LNTSGFLGAADVTVLLDAMNLGRTLSAGTNSSDVLRYTNANATGITAGTVSGFESLFITTTNTGSDAGSHNLTNVSGVSTINVAGDSSYTLTQLGSGIALTLGVDSSSSGATFKDGKYLSATWTTTSTASDAVTVNLGRASAATSGITLTLPGIETITLNQSAATNGTAFALKIDDTNTVNPVKIILTGGLATRELAFVSGGLQSNVTSIDASGFVGVLNLNTGARSGTGAMSIVGGTGNDSIIMKNASDTISAGSGTDTLKLSATANDKFTFDLSSTSDQVVTWNGDSNSVAQTGFESLDASNLVGSTIGVKVLGGATAGSTIIGTVNSDTINGGVGNDLITGGDGVDYIDISQGGTDRVIYTASGQTLNSSLFASTPIQSGDFLGVTGVLGIDAITGMGRGDSLQLYLTSGNSPTGFNRGFSSTGLVGASSGAADRIFQMSKGDYIGTGLWTFSSTGNDVLFQWDADGSGANTNVESVVLVGSASSFTGITANSAGVILFT